MLTQARINDERGLQDLPVPAADDAAMIRLNSACLFVAGEGKVLIYSNWKSLNKFGAPSAEQFVIAPVIMGTHSGGADAV